MSDEGGLKKVNRPGGGKDEEDEANEFTSFLEKPDAGAVLADIDKVLEETEEPQMTKAEQRRHQERFGFCCGVEW